MAVNIGADFRTVGRTCPPREKTFNCLEELLDTRVTMSEQSQRQSEHLEDVDDGCGCTEVWEHLSEHRDDD